VEIFVDDTPDRVRVDIVIGMTKNIPEALDRLPRLLGRQRFGVASQFPSGFTDNQQRVEDGIEGLFASAEALEVEPCGKPLDTGDIVADIGEPADMPFRRQA
jgi:hypothetical protein